MHRPRESASYWTVLLLRAPLARELTEPDGCSGLGASSPSSPMPARYSLSSAMRSATRLARSCSVTGKELARGSDTRRCARHIRYGGRRDPAPAGARDGMKPRSPHPLTRLKSTVLQPLLLALDRVLPAVEPFLVASGHLGLYLALRVLLVLLEVAQYILKRQP